MSSKIVLITGANSGIGYATAKVIASASEQYHVIMSGRSIEKLETAKSEIEAAGIKGKLSVLHLDVTDDDSIKKAASSVESQFGRLDVLVNNAGVADQSEDLRTALTNTYTVNVIGPAVVSKAFLPLLSKSEGAYSLYVTSGLGSVTLARDPTDPMFSESLWAVYRSSKSALNMLMVSEWQGTRKTNIKTFALCPGLVVSNLRGTKEEQRNAAGYAKDPEDSGRLILGIIEGKRDADVGRIVHANGVYPW